MHNLTNVRSVAPAPLSLLVTLLVTLLIGAASTSAAQTVASVHPEVSPLAPPPEWTPPGEPAPKPPASASQIQLSPNLTVSGFIHTDWRNFSRDIGNRYVNDVTVRRLRVEFSGKVNDFVSFRVVPDFAGSRVALQDAYVDVAVSPALKFRAGKAKVPFSLERAQSSTSAIFIEQGATLAIAPNYDIGVQVLGDLWSGVLSYNVGVFDGVSDGQSQDNDSDDAKDVAGRLQITPFASSKQSLLKGLTFGGGATYGSAHGTTAGTQLAVYRTAGQSTLLSYLPGVFADGTRNRASVYGAYYAGPVSLFSEWAKSSTDVTGTAGTPPAPVTATLVDQAYQVYGTFVLTGEAASYRGVNPNKPFAPGSKGWGALELVARYDQFRADDDTPASFIDLTKSATRGTSYTGGLNWYLSKKLRAELNYQYTTFLRGAPGGGNRTPERAILSRLQATF